MTQDKRKSQAYGDAIRMLEEMQAELDQTKADLAASKELNIMLLGLLHKAVQGGEAWSEVLERAKDTEAKYKAALAKAGQMQWDGSGCQGGFQGA